jgi:CRP/FNR family cyclic AMP-dependent transcriptional regulator
LGRGLPASELAPAKAAIRAQTCLLGAGVWAPANAGGDGPEALGLLVLRGTLCRGVRVGSRRTADLLGAGDLLALRESEDDQYAIITTHTTWRVLEPAWLAVLDEDFVRRLARWPPIVAALVTREARCHQSLAIRLAIAQVPKLSDRLLLLLWHLADRWGHVASEGVLLPLRLSHKTLAELAAAQRPSVSVALRELGHHALITRVPGIGWRLHGNPPPELTTLLAPRAPA